MQNVECRMSFAFVKPQLNPLHKQADKKKTPEVMKLRELLYLSEKLNSDYSTKLKEFNQYSELRTKLFI